MLTKKQAWLRVARQAEMQADNQWSQLCFSGLCTLVDDLRYDHKISDLVHANMIHDLHVVMDKFGSPGHFWEFWRGFTDNEDRIMGAYFMVYSGLTSKDFEVSSSDT